MVDILTTISIISFIATGVFTVVAIALWFVFKIPSVLGDLSGRTAKKSIEQMRQANEKTGVKSYRSSKENLRRGKLTDTMKDFNKNTQEMMETSLLQESMAKNSVSDATQLLLDEEQTEALDNATGFLTDDVSNVREALSTPITLLEEVIFIHTKEVI